MSGDLLGGSSALLGGGLLGGGPALLGGGLLGNRFASLASLLGGRLASGLALAGGLLGGRALGLLSRHATSATSNSHDQLSLQRTRSQSIGENRTPHTDHKYETQLMTGRTRGRMAHTM